MKLYEILARWDPEAKVWVAECDDIGLATEAADFEQLMERLRGMVPELVALNYPDDRGEVELNVVAKRSEILSLASAA